MFHYFGELQIVIFLSGKGAAKYLLVPKGAVSQKRLKNTALDTLQCFESQNF